ncbi:prophage tail fiber family protein, partial [Escherichia coli 88.1467]
ESKDGKTAGGFVVEYANIINRLKS